eukprot:COSAG05_NODE_416_length_10031_cov_18.951067_4_plen_257_part_00
MKSVDKWLVVRVSDAPMPADRAHQLRTQEQALLALHLRSQFDDAEDDDPTDGARAVAVSAAIQAGRYGQLSPAPQSIAAVADSTYPTPRIHTSPRAAPRGKDSPRGEGGRNGSGLGYNSRQQTPQQQQTPQWAGGNGPSSTRARARSPVARPRGSAGRPNDHSDDRSGRGEHATTPTGGLPSLSPGGGSLLSEDGFDAAAIHSQLHVTHTVAPGHGEMAMVESYLRHAEAVRHVPLPLALARMIPNSHNSNAISDD